MMVRRRPCPSIPAVLVLPLVFLMSAANGSDMEMSLQVTSAKQRVSTHHTDVQPSRGKPQTRPVLIVSERQDVVVSWKATNAGKENTFQDVMIHCFVVAEKEPGQSTVPSLKDPVQESALTMDFKPGATATGVFALKINKPGAYLVRVETREMLDSHGHEHYAALDLVCK